jgi:glycosyltransferase involved in cell wall biosynthesis
MRRIMKSKILILHHRTEMGGAERSILNLLSGLDRNTYEATVSCPGSGRLFDELIRMGIRVLPAEFHGLHHIAALVGNAFRVTKIIREEGFCLVHGNAPQTNFVAGMAGKLTGVPVVWHARVLLEPGMVDWDRHFSRMTDAIICNSQAIAGRFEGGETIRRKVHVIVNGVNTRDFTPNYMEKSEAKKAIAVAEDRMVIGCFDRLDPVKDHETVLEAHPTQEF